MAEIRTETVGSLLRPPPLWAALSSKEECPPEQLTALADAAVLEAITLQEAAGLDVITDGELRRPTFVQTLRCLEGFTPVPEQRETRWHRADGKVDVIEAPRLVVTRPIHPARKLHQQEFAFLNQYARARTKITIAAPSLHRANWHERYSREVYPHVEDFMIAMRDYVRSVVQDLAALGCGYVQLDAPTLIQRPNDQDLQFDAELDSSVFDGIADVTSAIHLCRGNFRGRWISDKGYNTIAATIFPRLRFDRLLLEYDSARAGDFEPLQHIRPDTAAVLGLVTTKSGTLEDRAAIEARVREASTFLPLERLALSPQCGFASGGEGNPLTPAQQEAKLRLVSSVARNVWG